MLADENTPELLGFTRIPAYDTLRECINDRLPPMMDKLLHALQNAELRWDARHEALLAQQYYHGTAHEAQFLIPINQRLIDAGIMGGELTVDGSYTGLKLIATSWEQGFIPRFKTQKAWRIHAQAAREDVERRYNEAWEHEAYDPDAGIENKARFLVRHGSEHDHEAVGRWLRDRQIEALTEEEARARRWIRSCNEAWNGHLKRLPFEPRRKGQREMLRRFWACSLTLHLVQLARIQHGVTTGLCRTAHIV